MYTMDRWKQTYMQICVTQTMHAEGLESVGMFHKAAQEAVHQVTADLTPSVLLCACLLL